MPLSRRTTREPRRSRRGKSVDSVHGAFLMKRAIIIAPYIAARAHARDRRTATQRVRNDLGRLVRVARKCRCGRPPAKGFRLSKFTTTMLLTISFDNTLSATSDLPFPRWRWLVGPESPRALSGTYRPRVNFRNAVARCDPHLRLAFPGALLRTGLHPPYRSTRWEFPFGGPKTISLTRCRSGVLPFCRQRSSGLPLKT